jgi:hypothetical protein
MFHEKIVSAVSSNHKIYADGTRLKPKISFSPVGEAIMPKVFIPLIDQFTFSSGYGQMASSNNRNR